MHLHAEKHELLLRKKSAAGFFVLQETVYLFVKATKHKVFVQPQ